MSLKRAVTPVSQLSMPGMPAPISAHVSASCCSIATGQEVMYLGSITGGPSYGSRGTVKRALLRKAVVDLGRLGTWRIPYYFLAIPQAS